MWFHIVFSPLPEHVTAACSHIRAFLLTKCKQFVCSDEYGSQSHYHIDIVTEAKFATESSLKKALKVYLLKCKSLSSLEINWVNVKVYPIDANRLDWQIGYCRKEGKGVFHNINIDYINDCLKIYNDAPHRFDELNSRAQNSRSFFKYAISESVRIGRFLSEDDFRILVVNYDLDYNILARIKADDFINRVNWFAKKSLIPTSSNELIP